MARRSFLEKGESRSNDIKASMLLRKTVVDYVCNNSTRCSPGGHQASQKRCVHVILRQSKTTQQPYTPLCLTTHKSVCTTKDILSTRYKTPRPSRGTRLWTATCNKHRSHGPWGVKMLFISNVKFSNTNSTPDPCQLESIYRGGCKTEGWRAPAEVTSGSVRC